MNKQSFSLSIIVVAYGQHERLERCLASIPKKSDWEVIVIDNTKENRGFAKACNLGALRARSRYLLFLNPDSTLLPGSVEGLLDYMDAEPTIGVLGPQLRNERGVAYSSYTSQPAWQSSFVVYSFLNDWFSQTQLVRNHWMIEVSEFDAGDDRGQSLPEQTRKREDVVSNLKKPLADWRLPDAPIDVGAVSGAALLIRTELFRKLEGFDERFFLYWEEVDLCRRVLAEGYRVVYYPFAFWIHDGAGTTPSRSLRVKWWFIQARWRFFAKHFGFWRAFLLQAWLLWGEWWRWWLGLCAFGLILSLIY